MIEHKLKGSAFVGDGFINDLLNVGYGSESPITGTQYKKTHDLSWDRSTLDAMLRQSWVVQRAVSVIAEDMCREKIQIQCPDMEASDIDLLEREIARLNIWSGLEDGIIWGRLYGGAAALILIDGQDMSTPLRPATIGRGQFKGLYVLDRWTLWPEIHRLVQDLGPDLGYPMYYRIATGEGEGLDNQIVHHSRVIRFIGNKLPFWERIQSLYWGQSIIETMYDRLINFDATTFGAAQLVAKAYLKIHKIPDLTSIMAGVQEAQDALTRRVLFANFMASNMSTMVIDAQEEVNFASYTFAGLPDVLIHMGEQLAGAIGTPTTRLFGQSPKGMSATGESDIKGYYDTIGAKQEKDLRYPLNRLMEVMFYSLFGKPVPDTFHFEFNSLWKLSDEESANIASKDIASVTSAVDSGVYTPNIGLREIRTLSRISGRGTTITDEDIDKVENAAPAMGEEDMPMGEDSNPAKEHSSDILGNGSQATLREPRFEIPPDLMSKLKSITTSSKAVNEHNEKRLRGLEQKAQTLDAFRDSVKNLTPQQAIAKFLGDANPEGETWITTKTGSHILLNQDKEIIGGLGGEHTGQTMSELSSGKTDGLVSATGNRASWPEHIQKQKIPPGWSNIQYSEDPNADLLATGIDSKGRKQYVYSKNAMARGQEEKFSRVDKLTAQFSEVDSKIKADVAAGPPKQDTAECMLLISRMGLRPGSLADTKAAKEARGATTLQGENVKVDNAGNVTLEFIGKKGVDIKLPVHDPIIADMLKRRKEQVADNEKLFQTNETKMSAYAKGLGGFKTKDFRTHVGSTMAQSLVNTIPIPSNLRELKKATQAVAKEVSKVLGNTPAVCLSAYINPQIFSVWGGIANA